MKIRSCSDFVGKSYKIYEQNLLNETPDFMYHAVEPEDLNSVMRHGLKGEIYLTLSPEEAEEHHPIVLKILVKDRELKVKDEGFVVNDVPKDQIEKYEE